MTFVVNPTVPMLIGASEYIYFDYTRLLISGQTVVSATYTCEAPVTQDGGTAAVNADGTIASARFTLPGSADDGAQYTVTCTATTANPTETKLLFALIAAAAIPS